MKKITILGSTGSIGTTAIDLVRQYSDDFKLLGLSSNSNYELLALQANEFKPELLCIGNEKHLDFLKSLLKYKPELVFGEQGLIDIAENSECDLLLNSLVGSVGLLPTIAAIKSSTDIALANKETLVVGGSIVTELAKQMNVKIIPVDSEHNAIFQCLKGNSDRYLSRIILTASGGPFLKYPLNELHKITLKQALAHPTWGMGKKISIDSATMVNKCLEIIEAKWLFDLPIDKIDVLIHPQSIVHGMAEFSDSSCLAMMAPTTMSIPILYSLYYPDYAENSSVKSLFGKDVVNLQFFEPDKKRYPVLDLVRELVRIGGTAPVVFNAANEVAVQAFLDGKIRFDHIVYLINKVLDKHEVKINIDIETLIETDRWARSLSFDICNSLEVL